MPISVCDQLSRQRCCEWDRNDLSRRSLNELQVANIPSEHELALQGQEALQVPQPARRPKCVVKSHAHLENACGLTTMRLWHAVKSFEINETCNLFQRSKIGRRVLDKPNLAIAISVSAVHVTHPIHLRLCSEIALLWLCGNRLMRVIVQSLESPEHGGVRWRFAVTGR